MTINLGIAVITYNRQAALLRTLAAVQACTSSKAKIIVADDGSTDRTCESLSQKHIPFVTGENRGIAWNKNRALFYLNVYCRCEVIIILEDDTYPVELGWELEWIEASRRWGHANIAVPWRSNHWKSGVGTVSDPIVSDFVSGQVSVFSTEALGTVGYLDTRFGTYGHEHVEHTTRLLAAGFGGTASPRLFYLLKGAIKITSEPSYGTEENTAQNAVILREIASEGCTFGAPWRTEDERNILQAEMKSAYELGRMLDER